MYASIATGIANFGMLVGYERNYYLYEESPNKTGALLSTVLMFVVFSMSLLLLSVYFFQEFLAGVLLGQVDFGSLLMFVFAGMSFNSLSNYYMMYLKNKVIVLLI